MKISTTQTQTDFKQAFSGSGIGVGKTKTSNADIDPVETDLRCENEVHYLFVNAFSSTIWALSINLAYGFGSVISKLVDFIVTLFKPFLN
ncbi:MAG: hypothetical protein DSZ27_07390 [Thiomicrospira sp.]|nr:MAG: hypothetical protein DSZ27_07390 [Thiomicrospira sp.]